MDTVNGRPRVSAAQDARRLAPSARLSCAPAYATEIDLLLLLLLDAGTAPTLPFCLGLMFRATGMAASAMGRQNILGVVLRLTKESCFCCLILLSTLGACLLPVLTWRSRCVALRFCHLELGRLSFSSFRRASVG
jgi:hypothetical protein